MITRYIGQHVPRVSVIFFLSLNCRACPSDPNSNVLEISSIINKFHYHFLAKVNLFENIPASQNRFSHFQCWRGINSEQQGVPLGIEICGNITNYKRNAIFFQKVSQKFALRVCFQVKEFQVDHLHRHFLCVINSWFIVR